MAALAPKKTTNLNMARPGVMATQLRAGAAATGLPGMKAAEAEKLTRTARRVYVGNLPDSGAVNSEMLTQFFNAALLPFLLFKCEFI